VFAFQNTFEIIGTLIERLNITYYSRCD